MAESTYFCAGCIYCKPCPTENKVDGAKKFFNQITNSEVKYHDADNYQKMLEIMEML